MATQIPGQGRSPGEGNGYPGSWAGKVPWRRQWLPTPAFLPGKFPGQRNLAIYSPWDPIELDMTE